MTEPAVTALVVEDEPLARRRLRDLIAGVPWLKRLGDATTAPAAIAAIDDAQPDLVFLDVTLPGGSGLDVLARIHHTPSVIFTTAYDQFAVTAFELGAIDYLLKPFGRERFTRAIERARPSLEQRADSGSVDRARDALTPGPTARLFVREAGQIVPIRATAIEWIEAADDSVIVHARGRQYQMNVTLGALEQRLDSRTFVRVHRSHIVNLDHVTSWGAHDGSRFQIMLRTGDTIVASRQRSRALREMSR